MRKRKPPSNGREAALEALRQVLGHGHTLARSLDEISPHGAAARDRALTQELCYGVLRWLPQLDAIVQRQLRNPLSDRHLDIRVALLLGLYQLMHTRIPVHAAVAETVTLGTYCNKPWAKGLINGVLRSYLRNRVPINDTLRQQPEACYAHPRWLIDATQSA